MSGEISLLSAIIWAVVSGLIGVARGVAVMALFFISKRADEDERVKYIPRRLMDNFYDPGCKKETAYLSDLAKGKSAKMEVK